jgi:hypothetical protein
MADCHRWLIMKPLNTGWVHPINESLQTDNELLLIVTLVGAHSANSAFAVSAPTGAGSPATSSAPKPSPFTIRLEMIEIRVGVVFNAYDEPPTTIAVVTDNSAHAWASLDLATRIAHQQAEPGAMRAETRTILPDARRHRSPAR